MFNVGNTVINSIANNLVISDKATSTPLVQLNGGLTGFTNFFRSNWSETKETFFGTENADSFTGTKNTDIMLGLGGRDTLKGGNGADDISGGEGADDLSGGKDTDSISGGLGGDKLSGGDQADTLKGGGGNDTLNGGKGNDLLDGGPGTDILTGGDGKDRFIPSFNDTGGLDRITDFNIFNETIDLREFKKLGIQIERSDLSAKKIQGEDNAFTVFVDDPLSSKDIAAFEIVLPDGISKNTFLAQAKFSTGIFSSIPKDDTQGLFTGFSGIDAFLGGGIAELIKGLGGDDILSGGGGKDTIEGGSGDDELSGGKGSDLLSGGKGNDILEAGKGDDTLEGGKGADVLVVNGGKNRADGGNGNDTLIAGSGNSNLTGGKGADTFVFSKDALKGGKIKLKDFDPDKDMIVFDDDIDLDLATFKLKDNELRIKIDAQKDLFELIIQVNDNYNEALFDLINNI